MEQVLHGQTAIVTGAGSPVGIGFAIARGLLRAGAHVAITATTERIHKRARELDATRENVVGIVADLTEEDSARRIVETVMQRSGRIDALVSTTPEWRKPAARWKGRPSWKAHTRIGSDKSRSRCTPRS